MYAQLRVLDDPLASLFSPLEPPCNSRLIVMKKARKLLVHSTRFVSQHALTQSTLAPCHNKILRRIHLNSSAQRVQTGLESNDITTHQQLRKQRTPFTRKGNHLAVAKRHAK